jgi:hypothetical protein
MHLAKNDEGFLKLTEHDDPLSNNYALCDSEQNLQSRNQGLRDSLMLESVTKDAPYPT